MRIEIIKQPGSLLDEISGMLLGMEVAYLRAGNLQGKYLVQYLKDKMDEPGRSGTTYFISRGKGNLGTWHTASAWDEYPAKLTGDLYESIGFKQLSFQSIEFGAGGISAPYAKFVEEGTSRMEGRFYLKRALRECGPMLKLIAIKELNRVLRRGR